MKNNINDLNNLATNIRITMLKGLRELGFGHIGGSMSMVELMAALYGECMNIDPENPGLGGQRLVCSVKRTLRTCCLCDPCPERLLSNRRYPDH